MTKALVIDDHPIVLQGCKRLLEDAGVEQTFQAATLSDGFRLYRAHKPDIVIVDLAVRSGALGGLGFIRRFRQLDKKTPILVFSMHRDPAIVSRALEAGAKGYLLKDTWSDEFIKAFQRVLTGGTYISHELASDVAFISAGRSNNPLAAITLRELQTLALIADGKPYSIIADELNVSYKTIANTAAQIKSKLGVRTLPELMRLAIEHLPNETSRRVKP